MSGAPAKQSISPLAQPVTVLWGVGSERAAQLARLKIFTVEDLLLHRPRRYEDRRHFRAIADLSLDEPATTRGQVVAMGIKRFRRGQKSVFELILDDGTARLHCRWWNLPFMEKYFQTGDEVIVFGKPLSLKPRTMDHPETEVVESGEEKFIHFNRITPIYPLTEGLPQRWLRGLIWRTLEQFGKYFEENHSGEELIRSVFQFPERAQAVRMLHFPERMEEAEVVRRRLALDEFLELHRQIRMRRKNFETKARALPCGGDNHLIKPFLAALGFKLTEAQTRVLREIRQDMRGNFPMRRLLQGDVGSGKTVVAACSALMAIESGFNAALMAPTEILAGQHFQNFRRWFEPLGVQVALQTGSRRSETFPKQISHIAPLKPIPSLVVSSNLPIIPPLPGGEGWGEGERKKPFSNSRSSPVRLVIGTHALLSSGLDLPRLGLVIIDEQHKFGVAQREQLVRKGNYPHLLVMTATPIPRTLGLTIYGDLDGSVIDELPKGRGHIKTFLREADKLPKVWLFVKEKLAAGRQVYVVYPRVEDTGPAGIKAVTKEFDHLAERLAPYRVGLLHGRLGSRQQEQVMSEFRSGAVRVLLATSLIEVGVDVPNATVMLIENAEQFGLAQLHQLRGRVGRGVHESCCILVSSAKNPEAQQRLKILEETQDGFQIAEADLKLRGPGELLGQQQSGLPIFRFGNLAEDWELIQLARKLVAQNG